MIKWYFFGSYSSLILCYMCLHTLNGLNISGFDECKLSILGYEYAGSLSRTTSGYRCLYWDSVRLDSEKIYDESFIDGSKKLARDYCRNPTNDPKGPWCYTSNPNMKSEPCNIHLCFHSDCRISGIGSEYSGSLSKSISGLDCKEWEIAAQTRKSKFSFPITNFPSGNSGPENRSCRNPSGNPAGPWCWVNVNSIENVAPDNEDTVAAELCDVPFCDEPDCLMFSNGRKLHHHFISLTNNKQNLTFWIKPWLSNKWIPNNEGKYSRLFITTSPSPYSAGFELKIPLFGGTMELRYVDYGEKRDGENLAMGAEADDENYLSRKITSWNEYKIVWTQKEVSVYSIYNEDEVLQLVYETRDSDFRLKHEDDLANIKYISCSGESSLWGLPCDESKCPLHTIYDSVTYTWRRLRKTTTGFNLQFSVRAFGAVGIVLAPSPLDLGSRIKIEIGNMRGTLSSIGIKSYKEKKYTYNEIKSESNEVINLSYWEWKDFTISIIGDQIQVHALTKEDILGRRSRRILNVRHKAARLLLWYSAYSSEKTVSLWTFYCSPEDDNEVHPALPPECVISTIGKASKNYIGYQRVTFTGKPCLPWVSPSVSQVLPTYDPKFQETNIRDARDFCRNPTGVALGPWCFVLGKEVDKNGGIVLHAETCGVRLCRYAECRMSGLGTEYIGILNRTISGRECQRWDASGPYKVPKALMNAKLYADLDITAAGASCRNPSRNNAGPWCFTLDPKVAIDVCDVRDCARPEACTHLVRGEGKGRLLYVLPQWKTQGLEFWLKEWDPDLSDGLVFVLSTSKEERYYKLVIGADDNQAIELHYKNYEGDVLVKKKRVHYVIPAGRWGGFWLRIGHGSLSFGYQEVHSNILFEWIHPESNPNSMDEPFTPTYLTFSSYLGHTIGMSFLCSECLIERTSTKHFTKLLPIQRQEGPIHGNFTRLYFYMRGNGTALIPLMLQPGLGEYFAVTIGEKGGMMAYFLSYSKEKAKSSILARALSVEKILHVDKWTKIIIEFNELLLRVTREKTVIMNYISQTPLLFYWFSVGSEGGEITWAANCNPPDIDGPPVSGGWSEWSPWQCSVTCGGGVGRRTRECNNPTPNVFGFGCEGPLVSEGSCNQFPCGTVSPGLVESIRDSLRSFQFNVVASEGESIWLHCGNSSTGEKLSKEALRQSPNSVVGWTKDGAYILNRSDVRIMDDFNIILNDVDTDDSGVYVCVLWPRIHIERLMQRDEEDSSSTKKGDLGILTEIENQKPLPLNVISLIVIRKNNPQPTLSVRETTTVSLRCNAISLGLIYGDLKIKWMRNGKTWKDYGFTTPEAISDESFNAKKEDAGEWMCVVTQPDLEFTWFTNWIRLEVLQAPNFFNRLMEDKLTAPIFGHLGSEANVKLVLFLTIGLFVILVVVFTVIIIRELKGKAINVRVDLQSPIERLLKGNVLFQLRNRLWS